MSILIIGATGTVGSHMVELLAKPGTHLLAGTRHPEAAPSRDHVRYICFDYLDPTTYAAALDGVTRLFILSPPGHPDAHALSASFLEQVSAIPSVERIVTMTAQGIDVDPSIPLRKLELAVEATGKSFVHLRPTWFAQNFHTYWGHGITNDDSITLPAEEARVAFIDARDIAASAAAALTRDDIELNRAYELTGPEALTHGEAAQRLSDVLGRPIVYRSTDDDTLRTMLTGAGLSPEYSEMMVGLFMAMRAGVASRVTKDVEILTGDPPNHIERYARDHADLLAHRPS